MMFKLVVIGLVAVNVFIAFSVMADVETGTVIFLHGALAGALVIALVMVAIYRSERNGRT